MPSTSLGIIVQHSTRASSTQPKTSGARQSLEAEFPSEELPPSCNAGILVGVVVVVLATVVANVVYVMQLVTG